MNGTELAQTDIQQIVASLAGSFFATWGACTLLIWLVPLRLEPFARYMGGRVIRFIGRMILVLVVVAIGVGVLKRSPGAVVIGSVLGWALAGGLEAWRQSRWRGKQP